MKSHSQIEQSEPVAITYTFRPNFNDTLVTVALVTGTGDRCRRDVLWRGRIGLNRDDLSGLRPKRVAVLLSDRLHEEWLEEVRREREVQAAAGVLVSWAKPSAPPEGDMGAAVQNVPLPGL